MDPVRVLFVDDEEDLVFAVVQRLTIRGVDAFGETNGLDALQRVKKEPFDAVVLDVRMPGLGGLQVLHTIKKSNPGLEVIVMIGHGSKETVDEAFHLGAFDYLQKPVDIDYLVKVILKAASKGSEGPGHE